MGLKQTGKKGVLQSAMRTLLIVLVAAGIFELGVNIGNGRIQLHQKDAAVASNAKLPAKLDYSGVNQLYNSLKENYDGKLSQQQLEDGLKHGLAESTKDPYTVYFTAKEAKDFKDELNNSFSGIGAQLGQDDQGNIQIIAPIDGFPAQKAGIKAKDIITDVDKTSTAGMSVDEAVSKIRGPAGTKVTLKVVRNRAEALSFTITRQDINLPSVKTKTLDGNIGYIQISTFANDTTRLTQEAANKFKDDGVKGIVLDLRNDPGGLLDAAVNVSSLWLPQGTNVLQEKTGSTVIQSYTALGGDALKGIPTVVLVNGGSASASEITAGALHDNKAAYIIGEKSYGKGVVQQLINFADGSQLKVTVASWYRPNGQNINHRGISPDKTVKLTDQDAKAGKDTQLEAAQAYLNK